MRRALPLLLFGLAGIGCHTYKYVDMTVAFDPLTFMNTNDVFKIKSCRVTVSGADSAVARLDQAKCPNHTGTGDSFSGGVFEFSTFAESGNLTFHLEGFQGDGELPNCKVGDGTATVALSTMMTLQGTLKVAKVSDGCQNGGNPLPADGGVD
jgi:hypothetical protein